MTYVRKKPKFEWSNFEIELMKYLVYVKGFNRHQAGLRIGRTCAAVKRKLVRLEQPHLMRPLALVYSFETEEYIKERWAAGASAGLITKELATRIGRPFTRNMVLGKLYRMGIIKRKEQLRRPTERLHRPITQPRIKKLKKPKIIFLPRDIVVCDEPKGSTVSFMECIGCKYPFGKGPYTFCGAPKVDKSSYCGYHHARCYKTIRYMQRPATDAVAVGSSATVPPVSAGEPLL